MSKWFMKLLFPRQVARYENMIYFLQGKEAQLIHMQWRFKILEAKLEIHTPKKDY